MNKMKRHGPLTNDLLEPARLKTRPEPITFVQSRFVAQNCNAWDDDRHIASLEQSWLLVYVSCRLVPRGGSSFGDASWRAALELDQRRVNPAPRSVDLRGSALPWFMTRNCDEYLFFMIADLGGPPPPQQCAVHIAPVAGIARSTCNLETLSLES